MNTALQRKCVAVRALMAKASGDEIRTRYEIALLILQIQSAPQRYGARGVDKLALALGCDRATLYRCGQVARAFDEKSMRRVLSQQKRQRGTLSWSHLIVLAGVADRAERLRLLDEALKGLSVRELERRTHSAAPPPLPNASTSAVHHYLSMTETFKSRAMIEIDLTSAARTDLDRLLKSQQELREICDRNLHALREALQVDQLKKALTTPQRSERSRPRLLAG